MKNWTNTINEVNSITAEEKAEIEFIANLVAKIVERRTELGITQRKLAQLSGVKQAAIARFEKLGVIPRIDTIIKILKPLNLKITLIELEKKTE